MPQVTFVQRRLEDGRVLNRWSVDLQVGTELRPPFQEYVGFEEGGDEVPHWYRGAFWTVGQRLGLFDSGRFTVGRRDTQVNLFYVAYPACSAEPVGFYCAALGLGPERDGSAELLGENPISELNGSPTEDPGRRFVSTEEDVTLLAKEELDLMVGTTPAAIERDGLHDLGHRGYRFSHWRFFVTGEHAADEAYRIEERRLEVRAGTRGFAVAVYQLSKSGLRVEDLGLSELDEEAIERYLELLQTRRELEQGGKLPRPGDGFGPYGDPSPIDSRLAARSGRKAARSELPSTMGWGGASRPSGWAEFLQRIEERLDRLEELVGPPFLKVDPAADPEPWEPRPWRRGFRSWGEHPDLGASRRSYWPPFVGPWKPVWDPPPYEQLLRRWEDVLAERAELGSRIGELTKRLDELGDRLGELERRGR